MAVPVFAFAAWSGTGKTTLIEKIVRELTARGLRVGVIKHDGHDFEIDREGKDSWRFTQAGAKVSVIASAEKTAAIRQEGLGIRELIASVEGVDILLVEGWKNESLPRIGIARRATGRGFTAPVDTFLAIVSDFEMPESHVPAFGLEDVEGICDFLMEQAKDFTHFNEDGRAKMVDVGPKGVTRRTATAAGRVLVNPETFRLIRSGGMKKGDVLTVAQVAGVMGAKRTPELIPMCHPILIDGIDLSLRLDEARCSVEIEATVSCDGRTGVEMEALSAVSAAALTVYDMCKAVQKDMVITDIRLLRKTGGVHGDFIREE